jgi:hypothetical protein
MKKTWIVVGLVTACFALLVLSYPKLSAQAPPTHPGVPIGATLIKLRNSELDPDLGNTAIRAFVATGSLEPECLATYSETNFAAVPRFLFCAPRFAFGQQGVLVSVFLTSPPNGDLILDVTVYQQGATQYAPPVLCRSSDGC